MYPDAYEVGVPNQGVMILYEVLNERPDALAERTYAVWPDLEALMREHGVPQFTVDGHRPVRRLRRVRRLASPPSSATPTCSPRSTSPASRCTRGTARSRTRSSSPAATRRSTPSRSPTSSTPRSSATASRRCSQITDVVGAWKAEGRPGGREELLLRLARTGGVYVPAFYDVDYLPDGRIQRVVPNRARRPVAGRQAHRDGPRRVALPQAAAGPAGRDGARADVASRSSAAAPAAAASARPA